MTVLDILKQAVTLINRSDLESGLSVRPLNSDTQKLLNSYNLVVSELCEEYLPLIYTETLNSPNGRFYFSSFSKTPLEIKAVYNKTGDIIDFKRTPLYIETCEHEIVVSYVYYPEKANIDDTSVYTDTKISERILALGVAREFLLLTGFFEEALSFDNRFEQSLRQVLLKNSGLIIRSRGWY